MIGTLINRINHRYQNRLDNIISLTNKEYDANFVNPYISNDNVLSKYEIDEIHNKWGGIIPYISRGYDFYRGVKKLCGFSSDYLPSSYYFPIVECALNPKPEKFELSNKSLCELIYNKIVKFPYTVLRKYSGIYLDYKYNPVSPKKAAELLRAEENQLIFKPSQFTVQGMGIEILDADKKNEYATRIESENIMSQRSDFVIQRLVSQSIETAILNPSSLNTMRITTLNLNGKISVCSRAIKCGPLGSIVDNIGEGKKGVMVGLTNDGSLYSQGFYGNGERTSSHNGIKFHGRTINNFDKILNTAIELHKINSTCKIIGWDLALDSDNEIVLIEGNAAHPGIAVEQMATGPIFGDRTDEVIDFIKKTIQRN